ncbi:MAG: hypothetical protein KIY12_02375 [Thermoplasmata archaeon]|uniref:Uncharacterized protein n=1 Tax=Candidatus Sysuiplasma superficiale TaxID=2823368 RepID=A0A8J7YT80_9ARCH|nr:hypothetical protein [Candidatus Sysuiplasma superficiale]MBX8643563.1 hypothetical protein [Candidatus Sysuiplasma superficiale]
MEIRYKPRHFYPKVTITAEMIRNNRNLRRFNRIRIVTPLLNVVVATFLTIIIMARVF